MVFRTDADRRTNFKLAIGIKNTAKNRTVVNLDLQKENTKFNVIIKTAIITRHIPPKLKHETNEVGKESCSNCSD